MSKAFTREVDDVPNRPGRKRPGSGLPPGAKNYLTADGALRFREEIERLQHEHSSIGVATNEPNVARVLGQVRDRISQLQQILESATIISPPAEPRDEVLFGATVTLRRTDGVETRLRIVGVDEVDADRDWISWVSPAARTLLHARRGERVRLQGPPGAANVEIVDVSF